VRPPVSVKNAALLPAGYVDGQATDESVVEFPSGAVRVDASAQSLASPRETTLLPDWKRGPGARPGRPVEEAEPSAKRTLLTRQPLPQAKRARLTECQTEFYAALNQRAQQESKCESTFVKTYVPGAAKGKDEKKSSAGSTNKKRKKEESSSVAVASAPPSVPAANDSIPAVAAAPARNSVPEYTSVDLSSLAVLLPQGKDADYVAGLQKAQKSRLPAVEAVRKFDDKVKYFAGIHKQYLWTRDHIVDSLHAYSTLQSYHHVHAVNQRIGDPEQIAAVPELEIMLDYDFLPLPDPDDEEVSITNEESQELIAVTGLADVHYVSKANFSEDCVDFSVEIKNEQGIHVPSYFVTIPMKRESSYRGVFSQPGSHRWCAVLPKNPLFAIGTYDTEYAAAIAHDEAVREDKYKFGFSQFIRYCNFSIAGNKNTADISKMLKSCKKAYVFPFYRPSCYKNVRAHGKYWVAYYRFKGKTDVPSSTAALDAMDVMSDGQEVSASADHRTLQSNGVGNPKPTDRGKEVIIGYYFTEIEAGIAAKNYAQLVGRKLAGNTDSQPVDADPRSNEVFEKEFVLASFAGARGITVTNAANPTKPDSPRTGTSVPVATSPVHAAIKKEPSETDSNGNTATTIESVEVEALETKPMDVTDSSDAASSSEPTSSQMACSQQVSSQDDQVVPAHSPMDIDSQKVVADEEDASDSSMKAVEDDAPAERTAVVKLEKDASSSSGLSDLVEPLQGWAVSNDSIPPWRDRRVCCFCHTGVGVSEPELMCYPCVSLSTIEHDIDENPALRKLPYAPQQITGRMLSLPDGSHAHVNCLRWSSDVVEKSGVLHDWNKAVDRCSQSICTVCGMKGATVGCSVRKCIRTFHLKCAIATYCHLFETKLVDEPLDAPFEIHALIWCPEHVDKIDRSVMSHHWQPCDPPRLLTPQAHDTVKAKLALSQTLSQRVTSKAHRTGAFTVFNIGAVRYESRYFHTANHIFPQYFKASRIFWSMRTPLHRTTYLFEVLSDFDFEDTNVNIAPIFEASAPTNGAASGQSWDRYWYPLQQQSVVDSRTVSEKYLRASEPIDFAKQRPVFRIIIGDNANHVILCPNIEIAFQIILAAVHNVNSHYLRGMVKRSAVGNSVSTKSAALLGSLTAAQFFGVGLPHIKHAIELRPESVSCSVLAKPLPQYKPCFKLHRPEAVRRLQTALKQLRELNRVSRNGAARAEPFVQRVASENATVYKGNKTATKTAGGGESGNNSSQDVNALDNNGPQDEEENARTLERNRLLYEDMSTAYVQNPTERLLVKRSAIHGWGLFARINFAKDQMIVEYIGERTRQVVADRREALYEAEGVGSCYLFRLDKDMIVDATRRGGMARFMNHCCEPNAYARIIAADEQQLDKHIVIFALRDIEVP
jgi:hypothetical protein